MKKCFGEKDTWSHGSRSVMTSMELEFVGGGPTAGGGPGGWCTCTSAPCTVCIRVARDVKQRKRKEKEEDRSRRREAGSRSCGDV